MESYIKLIKDDKFIRYEESGDITILDLIGCISMLKELLLNEIEPNDPNANVDELFLKTIQEYDRQRIKIEDETKELLN